MVIELSSFISTLSASNAAIKNTASPVYVEGWYPSFSATGQDVWLKDYRYDCKAIIVSAVGARCGKCFKADGKWNVCANTHILYVDEKIALRDYVYYLINDENWWVKGGSAQPFVKINDSLKRRINLPSLESQVIIVRQLDELNNAIRHAEKRLLTINELIKTKFNEKFGSVFDNPKDLPKKLLKEISVLITNGNTPKGGSENYVEKGILFLRSQNVWNNRVVLDNVAFIDEQTHQKLRKSSVHYNDILITKTGRYNTDNSSLGRAAIYKGKDDSANLNGHVYLVRLNNEAIPEFVLSILLSDEYKEYIRHICVGGTDKRQINLDQVEDFPIIVPSIEEQSEFVKMVEELEKEKNILLKQIESLNELLEKIKLENYHMVY